MRVFPLCRHRPRSRAAQRRRRAGPPARGSTGTSCATVRLSCASVRRPRVRVEPSSTATTSSTSRSCSTPGTSWSPIWRSRRRRPAGACTRPARAPHHPSASSDAPPRKGRTAPRHRRVAAGLAGWRGRAPPSVRRGLHPVHRGATRDHRLSRHPWLAPL